MTDQATGTDYSDEIEEIWALFAQEGTETLDTVESTLLSLEANLTDPERVGELFRALHTFKGMVRVMGLPTIEALSHSAEDLVGLVRDDGVTLTGEMIDLLLAVLDELRKMFTYALAHRQDAADFQITTVLARLKLMLSQYRELPGNATASLPPAEELLFFTSPQPASPDKELTQELLFSSVVDEVISDPDEIILSPVAVTANDLQVMAPIDPATDPVYLQIFRDIAEEEMWRLQRAQITLADGDEAAFLEIQKVADSLGYAAQQMGFTRIMTVLDDLTNAADNLAGPAQLANLAEITARLENLLVDLLGEGGAKISPDAAQINHTLGLSEDQPAPPLDTQTFLNIAQAELNHLRGALIALGEGNGDALPEVQQIAATLKETAQGLGYHRLIDSVDNLLTVAAEPVSEARNLQLNKMELALFEELVAIQEISQSPAPEDASGMPGFVWLFRRWHAVRVFANLARLREVVDDLHRFTQQFLANGLVFKKDTPLADEAACLLRAIYHSCLFYRLDQAARLTLALEDLYARVAQQEMTATEALITLTQTYVVQLGVAIEAIREGEQPELSPLEAMIGQTEAVLYQHSESQSLQVTREVLNLLDISPEFKSVLTPDSLLAVGQAMQAGQKFYTILADLGQAETIGLAFYEWSQTEAITLITNMTVYQNNRSLFDFLLAAHKDQEAIEADLAKIDPTGQFFSLKPCALRADVDPEAVISEQPVKETPRQTEQDQGQTNFAADTDALIGLLETVGKMLTTHASLHRITDRLAELNLPETITRIVKQAGGDFEYARYEIQQALAGWGNDLQTLAQTENQLGANLNQLYEMALALRAKPAAEILNDLPHMVEDLAYHQGKQVQLTITGADIELDHHTLNLMANPVRRLMWFAVTHNLEKPEQRQAAGKSPVGQVVLTVRKQGNRAQLVIDDDGHSRLNGTANVDLAAIKTELQAGQGELVINSHPEHGTRFIIDMPLSMVVIDGMVVRVGHIYYIIPVGAVDRIVKPQGTELIYTSANGGQRLLRLGEKIIPVESLYGNTPTAAQEEVMVVVEKDAQSTALIVDELIGQQQVLILPLQGYLSRIRGIAGCALLSDGVVGMVLNLNQLSHE